MSADSFKINQHADRGENIIQIGSQTVYEGLSPVDACKLAIDLFNQNFPKLQEQAKDLVLSRVDELMEDVAKKLIENKIKDMSPFADPDVQYAIYEAQKSYARFGTSEMLSTLSNLIAKRIEHNDDNMGLKVAIDKAIEISGALSTKHLDYLSLLFFVSRVKANTIRTIDNLKGFLDNLVSSFSEADITDTSYLNMLGCLQLFLFDAEEILSKNYGFSKDQVKAICPESIHKLSGDYSTSHVGTILAIVHLKTKMSVFCDPQIWIHD